MACSVQGGKGGSCSAAVPLRWSDMACLFRCAKMGAMGTLHSSLQQELQKLEVPFTVSTNRYDALIGCLTLIGCLKVLFRVNIRLCKAV